MTLNDHIAATLAAALRDAEKPTIPNTTPIASIEEKEDMSLKTLSNLLVLKRKKTGLNCSTASRKMGFAVSTLERLEKNRNSPSAETIATIIDFYKITPQELQEFNVDLSQLNHRRGVKKKDFIKSYHKHEKHFPALALACPPENTLYKQELLDKTAEKTITFGQLIAIKREAMNLNRSELSKRIRISPLALFNYEEKKQIPSVTNYEKISNFFKITPEEIDLCKDGEAVSASFRIKPRKINPSLYLGTLLIAKKQSSGKTAKDIAKGLGIDRSHYSKFERNEIPVGAKNIKRIKEYFNISDKEIEDFRRDNNVMKAPLDNGDSNKSYADNDPATPAIESHAIRHVTATPEPFKENKNLLDSALSYLKQALKKLADLPDHGILAKTLKHDGADNLSKAIELIDDVVILDKLFC